MDSPPNPLEMVTIISSSPPPASAPRPTILPTRATTSAARSLAPASRPIIVRPTSSGAAPLGSHFLATPTPVRLAHPPAVKNVVISTATPQQHRPALAPSTAVATPFVPSSTMAPISHRPTVPAPVPIPVMPRESSAKILDQCEEYKTDGLTVYLRKTGTCPADTAFLRCPLCKEVAPYHLFGQHVLHKHGKTHIYCAGIFCHGKKFMTHAYHYHFLQDHSSMYCQVCRCKFNLSDYRRHLSLGRKQHLRLADQLRPKVIRLARSALRTVASTVVPRACDDVEIMLRGDVIVADGITFVCRDDTVYVDCPYCRQIFGLPLLASHLAEDHGMESVPCFAFYCPTAAVAADGGGDGNGGDVGHGRLKTSGNTLLLHLLQEHGAYRCQCDAVLYVHEAKTHIASNCSKSFESAHRLPRAISVRTLREQEDEEEEKQKDGDDDEQAGPGRRRRLRQCEYCDARVSDLSAHVRTRHQQKMKCHNCGELVARRDYADHVQFFHQGEARQFKWCPVCDDDTRVSRFKQHMRCVHNMTRDESELLYRQRYGSEAADLKAPKLKLKKVSIVRRGVEGGREGQDKVAYTLVSAKR